MPAERRAKIPVLARREYLSRIRSKGFWIATVILPLFMAGMIFLPALILGSTRAEQRAVVVDETGRLAQGLADRLASAAEDGPGDSGARITVAAEPPGADPAAHRADLDRRVLDDEIDAWIWVTRDGLERDRVEYHGASVSNVLTQQVLRDALSTEVREMRLLDAGYDPAQVAELTRDVRLDTVRVTAEGGQAEAGEAGFFLAFGMFFLLYMILLIWGQQVLTGVIEEKTSRTVEVIVSAARPFDLMMGKLLGIGAAGLTQLAIWLAVVVGLTRSANRLLAMSGVLEGVSLPALDPVVAVFYGLYFIVGFFVFSTLYAGIGAAFNNVQEAQHLASIPALCIVAPILVLSPVINDPDGALAVATSLFPPFTPLLMPVRMAVKMPAAWQIALSFVLTGAFAVAMVWVCARIYRVGILMYGKKPTLRELVRWVRYV
jgi:ABC-2 type transport system permease protein